MEVERRTKKAIKSIKGNGNAEGGALRGKRCGEREAKEQDGHVTRFFPTTVLTFEVLPLLPIGKRI